MKKNLTAIKVSKKEGGGVRRGMHIVACGKFQRIVGAPPKTFPNVKYVAPEEVVAMENVLTALLGNEVRSKLSM